MIRVDDCSTDTGLRVRVSCDETDTTMQAPAVQWHEWVAKVKAGEFDDIAKEPHIPFMY